MTGYRLKSLITAGVLCTAFVTGSSAQQPGLGTEQDRAALTRTDDAIHAAFARGDVEAVMAYHDPAVVKALSPGPLLVGRDAVKADLEATMGKARLEFKENRVESLVFLGETAVEISAFVIHGTPKDGASPFDFRGRAMVVYVRSKASPTGWASIRELIQPAS